MTYVGHVALMIFLTPLPSSLSMPVLDVFNECLDAASNCVGKASGQYPKCDDCSKFLKCNGFGSRVFTCSSTLLYDVFLGVCSHPEEATCGTNTRPVTLAFEPLLDADDVFSQCLHSKSECVGKATGQYPKCDDCSQFFKCNGVSSGVIPCPSDLLYDVNLGVCTFQTDALCGTSGSTSAARASATTSSTSTTTRTSTTTSSTTTRSTSPTSPTSTAMPTTSAVSLTRSTSAITSSANVTRGPGITNMTNPESPECVEEEEDCEKLPLGVYGRCANCHKFVVCGADNLVFSVYKCPTDTEFDPDTAKCNPTGTGSCG